MTKLARVDNVEITHKDIDTGWAWNAFIAFFILLLIVLVHTILWQILAAALIGLIVFDVYMFLIEVIRKAQ